MTAIEQDHIVDAYTFELGKVEVLGVVKRQLRRLVHVHPDLAIRVAYGLGLDVEDLPLAAESEDVRDPDAPDATGGVTSSPALAMVTEDRFPADGRVVQILADDGADLAGIKAVRDAIVAAGAVAHVVATHKGHIAGKRKADQLLVDRSFHTCSGAECDAVVVAAGSGLADDPGAIAHLQMVYRHHKPVAAWGDGTELLTAAGVVDGAPGVVTAERSTKAFAKALLDAMSVHRHWDRAPEHPTLRLVGQEA
jgi:catalase